MQPRAHRMIRPPYRGTRGGEKQRKRLFYQLVDQVRGIFRQLFPRATWVRIEFGSNTPQLQQDLESIVANPNDGLNPAWHSVAAFSPTLRRFIPAGAPQGAANPPPPAAEQDARRTSRRTSLDRHLVSKRLRKELQKEIHLVLLRQSPRQLLPTKRQLTRSSSTHRRQTANNRIWSTRIAQIRLWTRRFWKKALLRTKVLCERRVPP